MAVEVKGEKCFCCGFIMVHVSYKQSEDSKHFTNTHHKSQILLALVRSPLSLL
jgi:hypothetical protein